MPDSEGKWLLTRVYVLSDPFAEKHEITWFDTVELSSKENTDFNKWKFKVDSFNSQEVHRFDSYPTDIAKSFALAKLAFFMAIKESDFNTDGSFKDQTLAVIGDIYKR